MLLIATARKLAVFGEAENPGEAGKISWILQAIVHVTGCSCAQLSYKANDSSATLDAPASVLVVPVLQSVIVAIYQSKQIDLFREDYSPFHQGYMCFRDLCRIGALAGY